MRLIESRPLTVAGVDFTGALYVKSDSGEKKVYLCLFTCAVTRAVHLEIVTDMTVQAFLLAFRRFVSRRSTPRKMVSDNQSTYLASAEELKKLFDSDTVKNYLADHGIEWIFIPKRAPWWGGFWERLIAIATTAIKKVIGRAFITLDEMNTVVTEIEAVMNDRPITFVSSNIDDVTPLTPSHLLTGRCITSLPQANIIDDDELNDPTYGQTKTQLEKRSSHLAKLNEHCWTRWSTEYLPALRDQHNRTMKNSGTADTQIKVGDVVLIHHDSDKRVKWRLGLVTLLNHGADGIVRSAELKTSTGITNRPIVKLYPLEVRSDPQNIGAPQNIVDPQNTVDAQNTVDPQNTVAPRRPLRAAAVKANQRLKQWAKVLNPD